MLLLANRSTPCKNLVEAVDAAIVHDLLAQGWEDLLPDIFSSNKLPEEDKSRPDLDISGIDQETMVALGRRCAAIVAAHEGGISGAAGILMGSVLRQFGRVVMPAPSNNSA